MTLRAGSTLFGALAFVAVAAGAAGPVTTTSPGATVFGAGCPGTVTITLAAREEYGRLVLTVSDDGEGIDNGETRPGYGIGLANVRDRLAARFGDEASIVSGRGPDGYATQLRLPIMRQGYDGT